MKHWKLALLGLILVCGGLVTALFVSSLLGHQTSDAADLINPGRHQRVSEQATLQMLLPTELKPDSVNKYLTLPENITGKINWQGRMMTFLPDKPLTLGKTLAFVFDRATPTIDNRMLGEDLTYVFDVVGLPKLAAHTPTVDAKDVPAKASITLTWDRPIVPLTTVYAQKKSEMPAISIVPNLTGTWHWLGTTTLKFVPTDQLTLATKYTVNIPAGIKTINGEQTVEPTTFSFTTNLPRALNTNITSQTSNYFYDNQSNIIEPTTPITVTFDQPVDLESIKQHLTLYKGRANIRFRQNKADQPAVAQIDTSKLTPIALSSIAYHLDTDSAGNKSKTYSAIDIIVGADLPLATDLTLFIGRGWRGLEGNLTASDDYIADLHSIDPLSVSNDAEVKNPSSQGCLRLIFNNPIAPETLQKNLTITPAVADWDPSKIQYNEWHDKRSASLPCDWQPATKYQITLNTGLSDAYGQKLSQPYTWSFRTADLEPAISLYSEHGTFTIAEKSHPPVFYIKTVNVKNLTVELSKIALKDFFAEKKDWLGQNDSQQLQPVKSWKVAAAKQEPNTWGILPFDVQKKLGQKLDAGIYVLTVQAPEYTFGIFSGKDAKNAQQEVVERQFFTATNLGITLKYSRGNVLTWVTDLTTGAPIADANISLYTRDGVVATSGKTDPQGFFQTDIDLTKLMSKDDHEWNRPEFWVQAEKAGDMAFMGSDWNNGIEPWDFGLPDGFSSVNRPYRLESYVYTERTLYRPGDTVHLKGIVRLRDDRGNLTLPKKDFSAKLNINDATGNMILEKTIPFTKFGTFVVDLPLATEASLGDYYVSLSVLPDIQVTNNYGGTWFGVKAYRKPEYKAELTTNQEEYFDGETMRVQLAGSYYFGAPLARAKVTWRATTLDYFFNKYTGDGWYSFALEDAWCWRNCDRRADLLTEGTGTLDTNGKLDIDVPLNLKQKALSQVVTLEADVTDPNNQVVSSAVSAIAHKTNVYIGVKAADGVVAPQSKAKIDILTLTPAGKPAPKQKVRAQLFARTWNTVKKKSIDGEYYYDNEPKDTYLRDTNVTTDNAGKAVATLQIDAGGEYRVIVTTSDDKGRSAAAGTSFYAWSDTYVSWAHTNTDRIEIIADKPEYKIGETAELLVKSPWQGQGVKALVTVERESILSKKVIDITSTAQKIEVPITDQLAPNAYISVVVLKPRDGETFDADNRDTGVPAFKIGYIQLKVDVNHKKITLSLQPDKQKYGPGETVHIQLHASDSAGKPVQSELSVGVVDTSVLALTGFSLPDLIGNFYHERPLEVATSQMLQYLIERFKPGSKGGGGAGLETKQRGNFKDTAYWNPTIETDAEGNASLSFQLPDNLTTWQILAIGNTADSKFGAVAKEIIETKKVILRSVRPRFAVNGDHASLGAIVHNFLDQEAKLDVTLTGTGFMFETKKQASQTVTIAPGGKTKVIFPVIFTTNDKATFVFKAESSAGRDEVVESIPLYEFGIPVTNASSLTTDTGVDTSVYIPNEKEATNGSLKINLAATIANFLPASLDYLIRFPYGCAEQTVSSFLPNLAVNQLIGFDAFTVLDKKTLEENITQGLQKLYGFQRGDGGFGYWEESSVSDPNLSAYILYALQLTKASGYTVDTGIINRAQDYLIETLRISDPKETDALPTRAYILFVLSEGGRSETSLVNNLYDNRLDLPLFAKAQLAMTLQKIHTEDALQKAKILLADILSYTKQTSRGIHFEELNERRYRSMLNTNDRTIAFVFMALNRIDPLHPFLPKIVRYMIDHREGTHWDTTQSTSMVLLALAEYLRSTNELAANFTATVSANDKLIGGHTFGKDTLRIKKDIQLAFSELDAGDINNFHLEKKGTGQLYIDIVLSYFAKGDIIPAADEGLGILRELTSLNPEQPGVRVGGTYRVKLTITVPEERHAVAVESPLPAGFEPIDLSLLTTQQNLLADATAAGKCQQSWSEECGQNENWRFSHTELRDDRVFLFADELPAGVYTYEYLVRATTPGHFHLRPARTWEMYYPETFGATTGEWFDIQDATQ